jgi:hypothetical protein
MNMKIKKLESIPNFTLDRLVSFDDEYSGKSWDELYEFMNYLKSSFPDVKLLTTPYLYFI